MQSVLVLIPGNQNIDKMGDGCWARFFDNENFRGDQITLVGPVDLASMKFHNFFRWGGLDSATVGPKATVTIFDDEYFKGRSATLKPSELASDLGDKQKGLFEDIESIKITCTS